MCEGGYNPQGFGAGVEHGCQSGAALFVLFLAERPGLVLDDIFVNLRDKGPVRFKGGGKPDLCQPSLGPVDPRLRNLATVRALREAARGGGVGTFSFEVP